MTDQERADLFGEMEERLWRLMLDPPAACAFEFRDHLCLAGKKIMEAVICAGLPLPANIAILIELRRRFDAVLKALEARSSPERDNERITV